MPAMQSQWCRGSTRVSGTLDPGSTPGWDVFNSSFLTRNARYHQLTLFPFPAIFVLSWEDFSWEDLSRLPLVSFSR